MDNKVWKIHPLCAQYPDIGPGPEWDAFKESIQKRQRLPVHVWKHYILDGKNRFRACQELGIECSIHDWTAKLKEEDLETFVRDMNEHRRHLTRAQRQQCAVAKRAEGKMLSTIAEELHVDTSTVQRDLKQAADKGQPKKDAGRRGSPEPAPEPSSNGRLPERITSSTGVSRPATYTKKPKKKPAKGSRAAQEQELHDHLGKAVRLAAILEEGEKSNRYYQTIRQSVQQALKSLDACRKA